MTGFTTTALRPTGARKDTHGSLRAPVYDSASFEFEKSADLQRAFEGRLPSHSYTRISNPTVEDLEQRLRTLSKAQGVVATSSGMAAISTTIMALAGSGLNVVTSNFLFGNTRSLFTHTLGPWGLEARFVDMLDLPALAAAIDKRTSLVFLETITNPQLQVADIAAITALTRSRNVPVILDNTALTPYLFRSREAGVAVEVISTTKYISGGGTSVGGAIVDNGVFDWSLHPRLADASRKTGPFALLQLLRREVHRNLGGCLAPHNAYLQTVGLETLAMRIERSCASALRIATHLSTHPRVLAVNYPGLPTSAGHTTAARQFGNRFGGILTFDLADRNACFRFMDSLNLVRRATNINDNKTLAIHPGSTIFVEYSAQQRQLMGVGEGMIRLSVGIEDAEDLIDDLNTGLAIL